MSTKKKITNSKKIKVILVGICIVIITGIVLVIKNINYVTVSPSLNNSEQTLIATITVSFPTQPTSNTKTTIIHSADPSNNSLLSYTYIPTNNYYSASTFKGFSISYPASWSVTITTNYVGGAQGSRDEIDFINNGNKLIIAQPIEGANCFYPPAPTGGNGGYYTNFSDVRIIDGKVWRRSKIDNRQFGVDANYIICQGTGNSFTDDNILGGIYYKVLNDNPTVISEMDAMIRSINLIKSP